MIEQLSVFLANEPGRLAGMCRAVADAGVNMHSLCIADTEDFGVVRIICDTPRKAAAALKEAGYRASVTKLIGVKVPNVQGGLANLLEFLDENQASVEYGYCFLAGKEMAVDVLKIDDESIEEKLLAAGFEPVSPERIYQPD